MKFTLLDLQEKVSKDGDVSYNATVLGKVVDYGTIKPATIDVSVDSRSYVAMKPFVGKDIELDIVIPKPQYPLKLNSSFSA